MNFVLHPWYIVLLTASRNFNDTDADDYLRGTTIWSRASFFRRFWQILGVRMFSRFFLFVSLLDLEFPENVL